MLKKNDTIANENQSENSENSVTHINKNKKSEKKIHGCLQNLNKITIFKNTKNISDNQNKIDFKHFRKVTNRKKRKSLKRKYPFINLLSKCNSKIKMFHIFKEISSEWKSFLKLYLTNWFILHLHVRQIKNISDLMKHRQNIFNSLDDPELLITKLNFSNNLIKNFFKGISNFFVMFYDELVEFFMIPGLNQNSKTNSS